MLDKCLRFLSGEKKTKPGATPTPKESPKLAEIVPVVPDNPEQAVPAKTVDTARIDTDNVTAILDIETNGTATQEEELRQRFIGRQPILNGSHQIVAYQLMLRNKHSSAHNAKEPLALLHDEMLVKSIVSLNIDRLIGDKLAFVGISSAMLESPLLLKLPTKGIVLAIQPNSERCVELLDRCKELTGLGYQIALDDYAGQSEWTPFLSIASYVMIDISKWTGLRLGELVATALKKGPLQILAKHVETDDDFEVCNKLSFHYFQGYYFTKPQLSLPHRLSNERIRVTEILNLAMNRAELSDIEAVFKHDAALSYNLLRYINSPGCGLLQKIRSIHHALVILGYDQLYRWLTLLLFTSGKVDERSKTLLKNALVRARLTELLGEQAEFKGGNKDGLFIVGIFSLLDALLNLPMDQAVAKLNLPEPVAEALVSGTGIYAPYLKLAVACEDFDQEHIAGFAATLGLESHVVNIAHIESLIWAEEMEK